MSNTPTDTETDRSTGARRDTLNTDAMQWLSALIALIGLWLVASPFIFESTDAATWNDTLVGTGIFLLAGYFRMTRDQLASVGIASLIVLLGLWALASPYLIEMGSSELATSTAASGLAAAVLAGYNAYANNKVEAPDRSRTRA